MVDLEELIKPETTELKLFVHVPDTSNVDCIVHWAGYMNEYNNTWVTFYPHSEGYVKKDRLRGGLRHTGKWQFHQDWLFESDPRDKYEVGLALADEAIAEDLAKCLVPRVGSSTSVVAEKISKGSQLPETALSTPMPEVKPCKESIKSTGGRSDYYKITLPEWLLDKQKEQGFIMLEDLAEVMYGNDFNYTNILKAQKRMFELEKGGGKEGNSFEYDATKCKYYVDKQSERFDR